MHTVPGRYPGLGVEVAGNVADVLAAAGEEGDLGRSGRLPRKPEDQLPAAGNQSRPRHRLQSPRYSAFALAGFAAGAAAFWPAGAFFTGAFFAAGGTGSASAVRSTTESSPPKSLRT